MLTNSVILISIQHTSICSFVFRKREQYNGIARYNPYQTGLIASLRSGICFINSAAQDGAELEVRR